MNCVNVKKLVASLVVCVVMPFSLCAADTTRFSTERDIFTRRIENIVHPILHGEAESEAGFFGRLWQGIKNITNNSLIKGTLGTLVSAVFGQAVGNVLFYNGFYSGSSSSSSGSSISLEALSAAEDAMEKNFPNWNPSKECPGGVCKCSKLGNNSKALLNSINSFFDNIQLYEKRVGRDYFSALDTERVFIFFNNLLARIAEENILHAAANTASKSKEQSALNDHQLKPYLKVIQYLIALPTEFHDVTEHWKKNSKKIDELLDSLPLDQRRGLYDYMKKLAERPKDPAYGHRDGDSSINLLFSGPSGSGKTHVGTKLPELLGFTLIRLGFDELRRGQERSFNDLDDLTDESEVSGFETKVLRLQKGKNKGIAPLNMIVFVDEVDEDRNYSVSELKEQFDQFKKMYFPSLGLTVPGFINCIFTTNNTRLLKTPALISRFTEISFPDMAQEKKAKILYTYLLSRLKQYKELKKTYDKKYFADIVKQVVLFDNRINIRILIDNIDSVIYFFDTQRRAQEGEFYLLPLEDRNQESESFDMFLKRTLGSLNLESFADGDEGLLKSAGASASSSKDFEIEITNPDWSDDDEQAGGFAVPMTASGSSTGDFANEGEWDKEELVLAMDMCKLESALPADYVKQDPFKDTKERIIKKDLYNAVLLSNNKLFAETVTLAGKYGLDWQTLQLNDRGDTVFHYGARVSEHRFCKSLCNKADPGLLDSLNNQGETVRSILRKR